MPLNQSKGNMYSFVTHTWNTVKGKCPHNCTYCYMKSFKQKPIRFDKKELKTDLGKGNFIFVGSSCDMWAEDIPEKWIQGTLDHCKKFDNKYLFQSKNPERMFRLRSYLPGDVVIGTTIETNEMYPQMGNAPPPEDRAKTMYDFIAFGFKTMVTIEPIMKFKIFNLLGLVLSCQPDWVNIGADSQGHNLPEPDADDIIKLIIDLKNKGVEVKIKSNLKRLMRR